MYSNDVRSVEVTGQPTAKIICHNDTNVIDVHAKILQQFTAPNHGQLRLFGSCLFLLPGGSFELDFGGITPTGQSMVVSPAGGRATTGPLTTVRVARRNAGLIHLPPPNCDTELRNVQLLTTVSEGANRCCALGHLDLVGSNQAETREGLVLPKQEI